MTRAYVVTTVLSLIALVLVGATINVAVLQGKEWREKGDSTNLKYIDLEPDRGNIYTQDGYPLATSVPYFDLHMDLNSEAMTRKIFESNVDSLSVYLARYVMKDESAGSIKRRLIRRRGEGDRYFAIKKNATYEELKLIKSFPLIREGKYQGGLIIERKSRRLKPYKSLASRTIGLDRKNAQSVGIEDSYDEYLSGDVGKRLVQRVGNVWIPVNDLTEIEPERGKNVITTLDMRMQDIAHTALERSLIHHQADFGTAILLEVSTGAIKAIVNLDRKGDRCEEIYNHAIGDATEPGSTFKLASIMALLEDKFVLLDDTVDINHGRAHFGRFQMRDSEWHEEKLVTVGHAFEISSNVGMAKVVDKAYNNDQQASLFIRRLHQFGLNEPTGIQLKGETAPYIKDAFQDNWNKIMTLPWMAHGYELHLTPLQTLSFYNAVANDGKKMKPYIVSEINDGTATKKKFKPQVVKNKIASKSTLKAVQMLLEGVMINGTGKSFASKNFRMAGKTGTTKLEYWKEGVGKYQASFAGYFPADQPKYSCIVLVNNPTQNGYYGGTVAGRVFKEIAELCLATDRDLMPQVDLADRESDPARMPTFQSGYRSDMKQVIQELSLEIADSAATEWTVIMPSEIGATLENRTLGKGQVPNVVGMGLRDAIFILENRGLNVKVNGVGKVREQSIEPGTKLQGQKIMLYLS